MKFRACLVMFALSSLSLISCQHGGTVRVHYLGHAAFVLEFSCGLAVLTDYGRSCSYGMESPIYGLGGLRPDIVTFSHDHENHAGGALPEGVSRILKDGAGSSLRSVEIVPIPTYERRLDAPDNTSYLFVFKGLKILHLGDCQALIANVGKPEIQALIRRLYPDIYDLVLLPIDFVSDISEDAAEFAGLLKYARLVPMHYWTQEAKEKFLDAVVAAPGAEGTPRRLVRAGGPALVVPGLDEDPSGPGIISLDPKPYRRRETGRLKRRGVT